MSITENVRMARQKINAAAESAGRSGSEVRLLAATKMNGPEAVQEAIRAGVDICAENRVQEFLSKNAVNAYAPCCVHFIGHLQKNKVKYLVGAVELIHSVDSSELMDAISRRAVSLGIVQDVLLEVNIGGETSKSGVSPDGLEPLLAHAALCPGLRVKGLMTIPPAVSAGEENRWYFRQMYELFVDIRRKTYDNVTMAELSMGMSGDYEEAVRCGATIVRLGTALFGPGITICRRRPRMGLLDELKKLTKPYDDEDYLEEDLAEPVRAPGRAADARSYASYAEAPRSAEPVQPTRRPYVFSNQAPRGSSRPPTPTRSRITATPSRGMPSRATRPTPMPAAAMRPIPMPSRGMPRPPVRRAAARSRSCCSCTPTALSRPRTLPTALPSATRSCSIWRPRRRN